MKWLLKNWWGRLYLLSQVLCLIATIFLIVSFVVKSHQDEQDSIKGILGADSYAREMGYWGEAPPAPSKIDNQINEVKNRYSKKRETMSIFYLLCNLTIPAIWGIGLFVCKGMPEKSKSAVSH
ncbi:MAG TPA: hypothetical protein VMD27_13780 [Candidatus Aquilonibacter sp.]|nr:hypothetical protein [Candidatus Aquilonibacter sp.]